MVFDGVKTKFQIDWSPWILFIDTQKTNSKLSFFERISNFNGTNRMLIITKHWTFHLNNLWDRLVSCENWCEIEIKIRWKMVFRAQFSLLIYNLLLCRKSEHNYCEHSKMVCHYFSFVLFLFSVFHFSFVSWFAYFDGYHALCLRSTTVLFIIQICENFTLIFCLFFFFFRK